MSRLFSNDKELVAAIQKLPQAINPRRELWPGIAARLLNGGARGEDYRRDRQSSKRSGWRNQAVAASIVIAFFAGLMSGRQIGTEDFPQTKGPVMGLAMQAAHEASEREYLAAFREFIPVGAARTLLETQAVENIENSWADLQQAESALLAALRDYPENTYLNQKLLDLRAQQLGFMRQLAMLDQFSRRKT